MRHFPVFLDLKGRRVVVAGAGEVAVPKLRLLLKTDAEIAVFGADPGAEVIAWAGEGQLVLSDHDPVADDLTGAALVYAAHGDAARDEAVVRLAHRAGVLVNVVDSLDQSDFITPAIVDRDPVAVAIGTEGTAPVLARRIKAHLEETLGPETGPLASVAAARRADAEETPAGRPRRALWDLFFDRIGPEAWRKGGAGAADEALGDLIRSAGAAPEGRVSLVGAGPGDPELLTLKARKRLNEADIVIHDRLVTPEVLELGRREAIYIEVGKTPFGPAWAQEDICALMTRHALTGAHVVRLKSGDPAIYGRLDEEMDALDDAGVAFEVIPGVTAASAAASRLNASLTKRRRNSEFRILTGHDVEGFADQDWRSLAKPGAVAAIYMGVRAARFLQGRLMIHGASPATPVTVVENASRPDERVIATTLGGLPDALADVGARGPAVLLLGVEPRTALSNAVPEAPLKEIKA